MKSLWVTCLIAVATWHIHAAEPLLMVEPTSTNELLFTTSGTLPAGDPVRTEFTVDGNTGVGAVIVRAFAAEAGTPAEGYWVYLYRVDLSGMTGTNCLETLSIPFGFIADAFDYNADGSNDVIFVNFRPGDVGTWGPSAASQTGARLDFDLDGMCGPHHTFNLGVLSTRAPATTFIELTTETGIVTVESLAPEATVEDAFGDVRLYLSSLSLDSFTGKKERARLQRQRTLLKQLDNAERKAARGKARPAQALLSNMARKTDGLKRDWVIDDPTTLRNEAAELYELINRASAATNQF